MRRTHIFTHDHGSNGIRPQERVVARVDGEGPCVKQTVVAEVVAVDGRVFRGTNKCLTPRPTCAREGMPTGEGYELCRLVCGQPSHAEAQAVALALVHGATLGATLCVYGHTYACESCRAVARAAGIARLVVDGVDMGAP